MTRPLAHFAGLEQRVLEHWRDRGWATGSRLVCGFSGGVDSLALAAVLARLAERGLVEPLLVHVDHGLRPESAAEQASVGELARALGLPFRGMAISRRVRELHPGVGEEEAARRERRRLLAAEVHRAGAVALALAHQQDDQAETVLLHLLRGSGLAGGVGMRVWSEQSACWWGENAPVGRSVNHGEPPEPGPRTTAYPGFDQPEPLPRLDAEREAVEPPALGIWRPLLGEPRRTLEAFVATLGLAPLHDPSNDDRAYRRNALRHDVLPVMETIAPGARAALARFAGLAAEDETVLAGLARALTDRAMTAAGGLQRSVLIGQPPALQRRVAREWLLRRAPLLGRALSGDRTAAVCRLLRSRGRGRSVEIGEGFAVVDRGATLELERAGEGERP